MATLAGTTLNLRQAAYESGTSEKTLGRRLKAWLDACAAAERAVRTRKVSALGPWEWEIDPIELPEILGDMGQKRREAHRLRERIAELERELAALRTAGTARTALVRTPRGEIAEPSARSAAPGVLAEPSGLARARPPATTRPRRLDVAPGATIAGDRYSWHRWAVDHNLHPSAVQHVVKGRPDRGVMPRVALMAGMLDAAGQRGLYQHFAAHPRFTRCSRCPHDAEVPNGGEVHVGPATIGAAEIDEGATRPALPAVLGVPVLSS